MTEDTLFDTAGPVATQESAAVERPVTDPQHPHPGQWRLIHLQVSNWGTFDGTHSLDISSKGFFLTGGPGTGKSTLLDAVSALLTPPRTLHFNAAASDSGPRAAKNRRTVASYIRGAWATAHDAATGEFTQQVLRPSATMSVLGLRFSDGRGGCIQLLRVMLLQQGDTSERDVKSLYVIARHPIEAHELEPYVTTTIEAKALERDISDTQTFRRFRDYRATFCQLLGIPDEKALSLLHKIQSAKELGDINMLLRDYMLDEPRTFALADQALTNFDNLSEVYAALRNAREQRDCLRGVREARARLEVAQDDGARLLDRKRDIELFTAEYLRTYLDREERRLALASERGEADQRRLQAEIEENRGDLEQLKLQQRSAGGGEIEDWKKQVASLEVERERRRERSQDFSAQLGVIDLRAPISEDAFLALRQELLAQQGAIGDGEGANRQRQYEAESEVRRIAAEIEASRRELESLERRASNLHSEDVALRDAIAAELNLPPDSLPFAAELLRVRPGEEDWTAAAEQVLRGFARSILVPERFYGDFAGYVDGQRLRRRVVYNRVPSDLVQRTRTPADGSLPTKIDVKDGEFAAWLGHEVASRFDYACVETMTDLRRLPRAVTKNAQVKHSMTRHEKNAERNISDRSSWVLGFDNRAKRSAARSARVALESELFEAEARRDDLDAETAEQRDRGYAVTSALAVAWPDVDVASIARRIANLGGMIAAAENRSSDLTGIAQEIGDIETAIAAGSGELMEVSATLGRTAERRARITEQARDAAERMAERSLPDDIRRDLRARFEAAARGEPLSLVTMDLARQQVAGNLDVELVALTRAASRAEEDVRTGLREFARRWPAEAGDLDTDLASAPEYLAILLRIEEERLPEVEERFFAFFNDNTLSDVQALATAIAREPAEIKKRLERINDLLRQVEFHQGRLLQLRMTPVHLQPLDEFREALAEAVGSTLEHDMTRDRELAEERFLALEHLMSLINDARTKDDIASRTILDVRRHVHFHAEEVTENGTVVHAHESGGPLSGGQNERLTTFCLAAALRYQLAGVGTAVPRYAPIIIDEAFSKGAGKLITSAMQSFKQFGFQVVLANPGKSPQALAPFIGGLGGFGPALRQPSSIACKMSASP